MTFTLEHFSVILGGGYVFFIWYKRRTSAPIVPLRTGADGLEEPLLVAEVAEDQVATGVESFVAVAEAAPSSAKTATMVAVPAAVAPGEPEPVVAEPASTQEPLPASALNELADGLASTGLASGANFSFASGANFGANFLGAVNDEEGSNIVDGIAGSSGDVDSRALHEGDVSDPYIVVGFEAIDIEFDHSNELQ